MYFFAYYSMDIAMNIFKIFVLILCLFNDIIRKEKPGEKSENL